jgi:hypothetical protein
VIDQRSKRRRDQGGPVFIRRLYVGCQGYQTADFAVDY